MSRRALVTTGIVAAVLALFTWEWTAAPRVHTSPAVERQLERARGQLLRTVDPFLYSDCIPGKAHVVPCHWVRVAGGRVTGTDEHQVTRARSELRRVD